MRNSKKGMGIGDLLPIGISFLVVAIILGLGAGILGEIQTSQGYNTNAVTQEVFVANPAAYVALAHSNIIEGSEAVRNRTMTATLNITQHYQMDYVSGQIQCNSTLYCSGGATDMNITYNYRSYNSDYNLSGFGLTSLNTLGKWLPTIALITVVVIIVGLVMLYLGKQYG